MDLQRVWTVAVRLVLQLVRDRRAMALVLLAPLVVMSLLAVVLRVEAPVPKIALQASGLVDIYLGRFEDALAEPEDPDDRFEIVYLDEGVEPREAVRTGLADAVLVFPDGFIEDRAQGRKSEVTFYVEGADPTRAGNIFARLRQALPESTAEFPRFLPIDCQEHCADTIPTGPPEVELIKLYEDRVEDAMDFYLPVLPPFFVFFFVFILSGISFLEERTRGTAERLLASPLARNELVTGYVLGFLPLALVQAAIVILFARFVIGGPWGGASMVLAVILLALVSECLGVTVSAFARTEFQVFQFIPIVVIPQILLSGMIWPVADFPGWLKPFSYAMPMTFAVNAVRDSAVRNLGLAELWPQLAALGAFGVVGVVLASLSVRRSL